jgi:hypothetical protein
MSTLSRRQFVSRGTAALAAAICFSSTPQETPNINDLIEKTHAFLGSLTASELTPFLAEWPRTRERRAVQAASLAVVRWLPQVKLDAPGSIAPVVAELIRVAPFLAWHQTYKQPTVGAPFLDNYGYTELAGLTGPVPSQRLACGFLLLGPETTYPRHRHEAEEIYVPLSGTAAWQHGNQTWHDESPGAVIHHVSEEPHAMRTGASPLLALYLWRSDNLNQKSRLDPPAAT